MARPIDLGHSPRTYVRMIIQDHYPEGVPVHERLDLAKEVRSSFPWTEDLLDEAKVHWVRSLIADVNDKLTDSKRHSSVPKETANAWEQKYRQVPFMELTWADFEARISKREERIGYERFAHQVDCSMRDALRGRITADELPEETSLRDAFSEDAINRMMNVFREQAAA